MFYPNVPGASFIQGATLIPESRVGQKDQIKGQSIEELEFMF